MKKKLFIILTLAAAMLMGACGSSKENTEKPVHEDEAVVTKAPEETKEATPGPTEAPVPTLAISGNEQVKKIEVETKAHKDESVIVKVEIPEYTGVKLHNVTESDVDDSIQYLLESLAYTTEVDGPAINGDTVNINYAGFMDGVQFQGGTNDSEAGHDLTLGSGSFISGFEEGLIGAVKGQEVDLNIAFPDPYPNNPDLAGKPVLFKVTVNKISRRIAPEFNDEFAMGVGFASTEEIRDAVRKDMNLSYHRQEVTEYLRKHSTVTNIPENEIQELVDNYINIYEEYAKDMAQQYEMDEDYVFQFLTNGLTKEAFAEQTYASLSETVNFQYITQAVYENIGLSYSDEEYMEYVEMYMSEYEIETYEEFLESGDTDNLIYALKADKAIDYIISNAEIVEE